MRLVSTNQLAECRHVLRSKHARDELSVISNHQDAPVSVVFASELVQDQVSNADRTRERSDAESRASRFFFRNAKTQHREADRNSKPDHAKAKVLVFGRFRVPEPVDQFRTKFLTFVHRMPNRVLHRLARLKPKPEKHGEQHYGRYNRRKTNPFTSHFIFSLESIRLPKQPPPIRCLSRADWMQYLTYCFYWFF